MRVFLILLFLATVSFADYDYDDDDRKGMHMPYDMRYLGLSDRQRNEIYRLLVDYRKQRKSMQHRAEALQRQSSELFAQEHFDKKSFLQLQLQIKRELLRIEADFLAQLHDILNANQRKRFIDTLEEWDFD